MLNTYRLRVYEDDNYEVETDRRYLIALDLGSPLGIAIARNELASARAAIGERRGLDERAIARMRVSIHEQESDAYVMDWTGA